MRSKAICATSVSGMEIADSSQGILFCNHLFLAYLSVYKFICQQQNRFWLIIFLVILHFLVRVLLSLENISTFTESMSMVLSLANPK